MRDYLGVEVEVLRTCCCCLRESPERNLKTPYSYHGKMEIYLDMLKHSLDIQLDVDSKEFGICSVCVGRLRDANDFKLQVERCQGELRALAALQDKDDKPAVKSELTDDCDEFMLYYAGDEPLNNSYTVDDSDEESVAPSTDVQFTPATSSKQLDTSCSVRLERIDLARATHACPTCQNMFLNLSSLDKHMGSCKIENDDRKPCGECGKRFKTKAGFEKHIQTHSTQKTSVALEKNNPKNANCVITDQKDSFDQGFETGQNTFNPNGRKRYKTQKSAKNNSKIRGQNTMSPGRKRVNKTQKQSVKFKTPDQKRLNKQETVTKPKSMRVDLNSPQKSCKKFACKICKKDFARLETLKNHQFIHKRSIVKDLKQQIVSHKHRKM